jgi:5'-nucleotidase
VVVTNDDGVDSVGIQRLALALSRLDHLDVCVVAPDGDSSGVGASLGGARPDGLVARRVALPDAPGVEAWAVNAPPAMCVLASRLGGFGEPPELVVSGINAGMNTGRAILHSGTVGAALTAQNFGLSALAVSLQEGDPWRWDTAADLAVEVVDLLLEGPPRSVLNLNVPNVDRSEVRGIRWARLAPFGEVRMAITPQDVDGADDGDPTRRLTAELQLAEVSFDPDTDTGLVREGFASLTTIVAVVEAWPGDALPAGGTATEIAESLAPGAPLHSSHRVPDPDGADVLRRPTIGT